MPTEHWTVEQNSNYRAADGSPAWILRYDPTPKGKKGEDGRTHYSVNFPALIVTDWVAEPQKAATEIALSLNLHEQLVAAAKSYRDLMLSDYESSAGTVGGGMAEQFAAVEALIAEAEPPAPPAEVAE